MSTKTVVYVLFTATIFLFNACKNSDTSGPPDETVEVDETYFPTGDGSSYKYDIEVTDSNGVTNFGQRSSRYSGVEIKNDILYQVQYDSITTTGITTPGVSYLRKSEGGVYYYIDTTGLSSSIPDTLLQYLTLDTEMRLLFLPIIDESEWPAFRINLNFQGIINFNPIEVIGIYEEKETLTLGLISGDMNVEAARIKFTLRYRIDPFNAPTSYEAYGWMAKDIGIVKWEGNGTIVGAFTGGGINFDDTTSTVIMNITAYNIN